MLRHLQNSVATEKNLSQQHIHVTIRNSVTTEEISFTTNVKNHQSMSQHSKECCNKVEEMEEENYVATKDEERRTEDCRDKEIYVSTEFRAAENDKVCCNKVIMSRHKTLISRHKLNYFSKTLPRHKNIMSRQTPRRNSKNHVVIEN